MPSSLDRLIYIDDSGHPQAGTAVYGWVEFAPSEWASTLRAWLTLRKMLWRERSIPVEQELHMTEYVQGRGRISKRIPDQYVHNGIEFWKDFGRDVAEQALDTIRCCQGVTVGAVFRQGPPEQIAATKAQLYRALVDRFEAELERTGSLALIFMDGDGSDPSYRTAHRGLALDRRHVIEDAVHIDSRHSQLVQMADHVAWTANALIGAHPRNAFAAGWYQQYLAERDPSRGPQPA